MSHYRKVETFIWNDKKFNTLSSDGKLLFLFLLTHPNLTMLGAMRASSMGLAGELQWSYEQLEKALGELLLKEMVNYEYGASLIWLPNFLKYNPPDSPNIVKSWESALSYLPECKLKDVLMRDAEKCVKQLGLSFQSVLSKRFRQLGETDKSVSNTFNQEEERDDLDDYVQEKEETLSATLSQPTSITLSETPPRTPTVFTKHRALNTEHKTLSIKQDDIVLENNSEEKNNPGEIKNIVAPTRQKIAKPPDAEVIDVFRCWQRTLGHPQAQLDAKRRKMIRRALASGYNVTQLFEAIKGCSKTPHNIGENEQGQRYDGLHIIFRDADQIDRFIRNANSPPQRRTKADQLLADNLAAGERWLAKFNDEEKIINACE